jgi:putative phosphoribosyl transferase
MYFIDRLEAGEKLSDQLKQYSGDKNCIILGLPRGGVVTAYEVSKRLHLPLDIICPRKIGAPFNPEYAIGAVTETGKFFSNSEAAGLPISAEYLQEAIRKETEQAKRRLQVFRVGMSPRNLKDKTVILIDDGLATGLTMKAAISSVRDEKAKKIVVAVPVSPRETLMELKRLVDEVVCLSSPAFFQAIGQFYQDFRQVEDEEVIEIMSSQNNDPQNHPARGR